MAIDYLYIRRLPNGDLEGYHPGCGCCGGPTLVNVNDLREHVEQLRGELAEAEHLLAEMEGRS